MKSDFARLCQEHRRTRGLKQKQVAEAIGVKLSTYGNVETSPFKVIRRERAEALAGALGLDTAQRTELLDAWERCPLSPYGERQRERWTRRNALRSKVKNYDALRLALVEVLGIADLYAPEGGMCSCLFGGGSSSDANRSCEVCWALERLGIFDGWQGDATRALLQKLQEKLTAEIIRNPGM